MKKYFTTINKNLLLPVLLLVAFVFTTSTAFAALTLNSTTVSSDGALTLTGTANSIWDLGASHTLSLQTTNNGPITTGSGLFTLGGSLVASIIRPLSDSTTAIQINKADGTTNVLNIDTTNSRVGIGTTAPGASLDVQGSVNLEKGTGSVSTDAVTISKTSGVITDSTDINMITNRAAITLTNTRIAATSVVVASICSTPDSDVRLGVAVTPGSGSAVITVYNSGNSPQYSDYKICFVVTN